ncbi:MAG TPA: cell division protein ZapE [Dokdonella sp.]|uniref:cell division protein ZapE n=1 Tax=Dokdonella sp. TaxID=2291710 RepID=UPI0025BA3747|nr:cell division protein ZapE [Dokdonella sp.]MBX3691017.1 AFG1 family ATPase [Dokdonella sp.]MCW5568793.1 AFG1 family ATPase [Dokdonella sp.]HNR91746.1 cell division protein ZapE [Dokdonella sp.]
MNRHESPGARYARGVAAGEWQADSAQAPVLVALDRIHAELAALTPPSLWQRLRGQRSPSPRGLYLWGSVGRGKTFLMDLFFESLPTPNKRRVHFHRFMRGIHAELRTLSGHSDPLVAVAARIAAESRVLCLDEFFVLDIGDAMILGNLLRALFADGVVLVTTSNTAPPNLYRDGLQRERFLPAIALIERHCEVVELVSATDWRLRALRQAPVYHVPPDMRAERAMLATFHRVARGAERECFTMTLNERPIDVRREADGVIWFDFAALCDGPRGVADYIELARSYHTILVSGVPEFTPQTEDAAQRFVELVDELYDRGVNLVLSAAVPIIELYDGRRLRAVFARTESRLIEMQSEEYMAREHLA